MSPDVRRTDSSSAPGTPPADRFAIGAIVCAAAAFRVATNDDALSLWTLIAVILVEAIVVVVAAVWMRSARGKRVDERDQSSLSVLLFVGVLLFHAGCRLAGESSWFGGMPWEVLLIASVRTLMQGMVIYGTAPRFQRLTMLLSVFVVVFSISLARSGGMGLIVVLYCVPTVIWLVMQDWQRFADRLLDRDEITPRKRWSLLLLPTLLIVAVAFSITDEQLLNRARGWFPSSGGEGGTDPFARDGIGDGNALVAGEENIKSIAPLEDAPFLLDDRPSLYDTFDDTYEDAKPPKKIEKAIPLDPSEAERGCERVAKSETKAKEFSTLRENRRGVGRELDDRTSEAQFHVAGRVPLHLRAEMYDLFDGLNWYPAASETPMPLSMRTVEDKPWLRLSEHTGEWFSEPETHVLKMIRYGSPIIPAPPHTTGIHISKLNRIDLYRWRRPGIVALDRDEMPPLLPIRIASKTVDRDRLPVPNPRTGFDRPQQLPDLPEIETIRGIAEDWTADAEPGWGEIDAIVQRLRNDYRHDRSILYDDETRMPVERFLTETRAGPDYLFATAAALMLRSKGYSCRVVSGFYASPEQYDRRTKLTSVYDDDVHFWVEVYCGRGTWVTIEPTPGYDVLEPPRSLWDVARDAGVAVVGWVKDHPMLFGLLVLVFGLLVRFRVVVLDSIFSRVIRFVPLRSERRLACSFAHLERRLRWVGCPRPGHRSPAAWWSSIGVEDDDLQQLHNWVDARLFAGKPRPITDAEAKGLTDRLLTAWTLRALRELSTPRLTSSAVRSGSRTESPSSFDSPPPLPA